MSFRPCPFCESSNVGLTCIDFERRGQRYAVKCNFCHAQGGAKVDEPTAIDAWNEAATAIVRSRIKAV